MLVLINLLWVSAGLIPERGPASTAVGLVHASTSITRLLLLTAVSLVMPFPAQILLVSICQQ